MTREIDELIKENDELKTEVERLRNVLDENLLTMEAMAEGMNMLTHPNWRTLVDNKESMIKQTVIDWMARRAYERDTTKRSK